jgi:hypothetical protein
MALTEIQLPIKANFYAKLQDAANKLDKTMEEYRRIQEFIGRMDHTDLDAMGVPEGQARTDLMAFRDAINELLSLWEGNAVAQPDIAPCEAIDRIRWIY